MIIKYLGHSCFYITTNKTKILIDPYNQDIGLKLPKTEANIVLVSHDHSDHNAVGRVKNDDYFLINEPGEYEVNNVFIKGINSYHDNKKGSERGKNTIFSIYSNQVNVCHLGDLGHQLDANIIEELNNVDLLMVPIGGKYTIDIKDAIDTINKINPRYIMPMHYDVEGIKIEGLAKLDEFVKEVEFTSNKYEGKFKLSVNPNKDEEITSEIILL